MSGTRNPERVSSGGSFLPLLFLIGVLIVVAMVLAATFGVWVKIASWGLLIGGGFMLAHQFFDDKRGVQLTGVAAVLGIGILLNMLTC